MSLPQSKADAISKVLNADTEQGKALLALAPQDALAKINAQGHNFTHIFDLL